MVMVKKRVLWMIQVSKDFLQNVKASFRKNVEELKELFDKKLRKNTSSSL